MKYPKSKEYNIQFLRENMMGPNSMKILEELTDGLTLTNGMKVLDLGCGKGLTSIFLAKVFGVQVFAVDLWISATDNYNRFKKMKLENRIIPIHSDATQLPFANEYFDAVISVDAYHYFGNNNQYFDTYLSPLIKKGGTISIGIPGLKNEIISGIPDEMRQYWSEESLATWHACNWWEQIFKQSVNIDICSIKELMGFEEPWSDWLVCENEFAIGDRAMLKADAGRYMNLISIIGKKK